MIGSESLHEEVARDAIEVLVSADILEEALVDAAIAAVLTAGAIVTISG